MLARLMWCGRAETRSVACVGLRVVKMSDDPTYTETELRYDDYAFQRSVSQYNLHFCEFSFL